MASPIFEARTSLPRQLYNIPQTRTQFLANVRGVLQTAWQADAQLAEIDRVRALLTPVLQGSGMQDELREMLIWQRDLKRWIASRAASVNSQLANPPANVPPDQPPHWCDVFTPADARAWTPERPGPWRR